MNGARESGRDDLRPLIAHVVYRFDVGGLENGVVNLINRLPAERFRHAVIALTEVTAFRERVRRNDVTYVSLNKAPGPGIRLAPRLYRLFRELRPAVVHSRNLAALEASLPAWLAGVPVRIHGEHGWDVGDLDGTNARNLWTRRIYRPFVSHYIALSQDLARYLTGRVSLPEQRVSHICNGVDTVRFAPPLRRQLPPGAPFAPTDYLVGTVGRMQPVKDHETLVKAFLLARERDRDAAARMRLVIVGDGPQRPAIEALLERVGAASSAWIAGSRDDVPALLGQFDSFVLPSLAEGISNTILEAMACGRPIIATNVGGNGELIDDGNTGDLVVSGDAEALCAAILRQFRDPERNRRLGEAARQEALRRFSIDAMVSAYSAIYQRQLDLRGADRRLATRVTH
jgi:sugar transferase (PEP-CTERM/EpsH1 system associated)